ncbi:MAG: PaaI family thioesterase [Erysipelothrix sp.]|nr:PaaI family thioesterase [Erysipelothrix sp.]
MKLINDVILKNNLFQELLKMNAIEYSLDKASARMKIDESIMTFYGMVYGGAIFALAEVVSIAASVTNDKSYVTMDSTVKFLNPAYGEYLVAHAEVIYRGEGNCSVDVVVNDENDTLIAKAMLTMFEIESSAV